MARPKGPNSPGYFGDLLNRLRDDLHKVEAERDAARAEVKTLRSAFKQWRNATESRCRLLSSRESSDSMLKPDADLIAAFEADHEA